MWHQLSTSIIVTDTNHLTKTEKLLSHSNTFLNSPIWFMIALKCFVYILTSFTLNSYVFRGAITISYLIMQLEEIFINFRSISLLKNNTYNGYQTTLNDPIEYNVLSFFNS